MTFDIPTSVAEWAAGIIGSGARLVTAERLREFGGPWLVRFDDDGRIGEAILKTGSSPDWAELYRCEAAALKVAADHGVPAPQLLGCQADLESGVAALLMSRIGGTTEIPRIASAERLRAVGRMAATIHRVALQPSEVLPLRTRHTSWTDYALWRRWGNRYRAAPDSEQNSILGEFLAEHPLGGAAAMTGAVPWSIEAARDTLSTTESTPLLDAASEALLRATPSNGSTVFVHGDLWQGNTVWDGDTCVGVIDWEVGGAGQPGVDLGCLRWDAAMLFGAWAAEEVLAGWQDEAGHAASDVAYWDLVAVLNYPTDMARLLSSLGEHGRPDLDVPTLTERRDAWAAAALDHL